MRFRERRPEDAGDEGGGPADPAGGNLDDLRRAARGFLEQGDRAINEALSRGDSEAFLGAIRQQGGE